MVCSVCVEPCFVWEPDIMQRAATHRFSLRSSNTIGLILCAGLCHSVAVGQTSLSFTEVTDTAGLSGALRDVAAGSRYSAMHGGGAVGDFNNDGYHDIFILTGGGSPDRLYINNGDGTFTDRAPEWGLDLSQHSFGASAADYNNDGYLDYEELDKQMRSAMLKHFLTEEQNAKKHSGQLFNVSHDCFLLRSIRLAVNLAS